MSGFTVLGRVKLVDDFSAQAAKMGASSAQLGQQFGALQKRSGLLGAAISNIGTIGAFSAAAGFVTMMKNAIEFESSIADINKVMSVTPQQLDEISAGIIKMSRTIPLATKELAEIVATAGQLGVANQDIIAFTEVAAKMATAFEMPAREVATQLGKLQTIHSMTIPAVEALGDTMNYLGNNTAATERQIMNFSFRAAGASSIAKISADQIAALGASFVSIGMPAEVAARAFNALTSKLATAPQATAKAQKAFSQLGIDVNSLADGMQQDGVKTLLNFFDRLEAIDPKQRASILVSIFGVGWQDEIARMTKGLQSIRKNLASLDDVAQRQGSMTKEYEKRIQTTASSLQLFKNAFYELSVSLGDLFLPVITVITKSLTAWVQLISQVVGAIGSIGSVIGVGKNASPMLPGFGAGAFGTMKPNVSDYAPLKPGVAGANGTVDVNVKVSADAGSNAKTSVTSSGTGLNVGKTSSGSFNNHDITAYGY